jgi:hypothetical protein
VRANSNQFYFGQKEKWDLKKVYIKKWSESYSEVLHRSKKIRLFLLLKSKKVEDQAFRESNLSLLRELKNLGETSIKQRKKNKIKLTLIKNNLDTLIV